MRKGQAVLEFLMTYGWGLIIILGVALFAFGFFVNSPQNSCYTAPSLEDNDVCHEKWVDRCGVHLSNCASGILYKCVQNVKQYECEL